MAKRAKAAAGRGLSGVCKLLSDGIKELKKDIAADKKAISAQERFIRQLTKQGAKPAIINQAKQRLEMLNSTLEGDEAQLIGFQEEFAAECRPS